MKRDDKTLLLRGRSGFSLVELLVYMGILVVLMALVMTSFTQTLRRGAQQSGIAETQIETGVGLGLLRADLEAAGFGLPWVVPDTFPYNEPDPSNIAINLNRIGTPPTALDSADNTAFNGSDRLVIRAANVVLGASVQKWGILGKDDSLNTVVQSAGPAFTGGDQVIALRPGNSNPDTKTAVFRSLVTDGGGTFSFPATVAGLGGIVPSQDGEKLVLYGIGTTAPTRPFNRTDYSITNANVPAHCAPGTGVLSKAMLNQANNTFNIQPVADCVADFQVVYFLDNGAGGLTPVNANQLPAAGADQAEQIRNQVKEVRCYILLHEGGIDRSYTHPSPNINVGAVNAADGSLVGQQFTLNTRIGATWANYRWKVVNVTVAPQNFQ